MGERAEADKLLEKRLQELQDPHLDLVNANRDAILRIHQEGVSRINKVLTGGGDQHDHEKLVYIGRVLYAIYSFHPMHDESWCGWPNFELSGEPYEVR